MAQQDRQEAQDRRLLELDKANAAHQKFMEKLAEEKAARDAAKSERESAKETLEMEERSRFEPIWRSVQGERVPGVQVDPETFDTTIIVGGKPAVIPGDFVMQGINKHYGYKLKPAKSAEDVAAAKASVADMVRQSGVKLAPSEVSAMGQAAAKNPSLLDALPDALTQEAEFQKEQSRAKGLISAGETYSWGKVPKDVRSGWNPASWFTDRPGKVGLMGFDEKGNPLLKNLTLEEEEKGEAKGIFSRGPNGTYLLDGNPVVMPESPGPILRRVQPRAAPETAPVPAASAPVQSMTVDAFAQAWKAKKGREPTPAEVEVARRRGMIR